jgi:hypothetical protein
VEDGVEAGEVRDLREALSGFADDFYGFGVVEWGEGGGGFELVQDFFGDEDVVVDICAGMDDAVADGVGGWESGVGDGVEDEVDGGG